MFLQLCLLRIVKEVNNFVVVKLSCKDLSMLIKYPCQYQAFKFKHSTNFEMTLLALFLVQENHEVYLHLFAVYIHPFHVMFNGHSMIKYLSSPEPYPIYLG